MLKAPHKYQLVKKTIAMRVLAKPLNIYLLIEYPKSGGTWLKNMVADALEIPAWTRSQSPFKSCVIQSHSLNTIGIPLDKTVVMHRDGRDIMVSFYFHSFFYNDRLNAAHVDLMRSRLKFEDYSDVKKNLLEFMRFVLESPVSPKFSWPEFVDTWLDKPGVVNSSYEKLRQDTSSELVRIISHIRPSQELLLERAAEIANAFTMENMKSKSDDSIYGNQTTEVPFIRTGSVGGWSEYFTDEALAWFEQTSGQQLLKLGYKLGRPGFDN